MDGRDWQREGRSDGARTGRVALLARRAAPSRTSPVWWGPYGGWEGDLALSTREQVPYDYAFIIGHSDDKRRAPPRPGGTYLMEVGSSGFLVPSPFYCDHVLTVSVCVGWWFVYCI